MAPMSRVADRVREWWRGLERGDRVRAVLLAVIGAGLVGHQAAVWNWYIEDAAISFAFARNLIHGEGLVAFPGGERVEGYSNPTWVAVLAALQLFGLDPFRWVKVLQLVLGLAALPPVYLAMREAVGKNSDAPLIAAAVLAANSQLAIWGGAGLENSLLHLLMALGIWRMMVELRVGGVPWSSVVWMLLALTRPEGILYSAIAGAWAMLLSVHSRRSLLPTVQWLGLFFVPWTLYQVWHYWYFAWPFPNTYYGKLGDRDWVHWVWNEKAWKWTRNFFHQLAQIYFLPVWVLGVVGDGRWRVGVATAVTVGVGVLISLATDQRWLLPTLLGALWIGFWYGLRWSESRPPRHLIVGATVAALAMFGLSEGVRYAFGFVPTVVPVPDWLADAPPYVLASFAVLLPLLGSGARGWQLRGLVWLLCCASVLFAVYVQWDWMKGFRWYAPAAVPGSLLFAFGADALVQLLEEMFSPTERPEPSWRRYTAGGVAAAVGLVVLQLIPNVVHTVDVATAPDTSPRGVLPRVRHVQEIEKRLKLDRRLVDLDVDQGAHLWWGDFEMMDMAGLIDVPFAHQHFERPFVREYVFQEMRPHYVHVHGQWATNTKIPSHPEWRKEYLEIPGYPAGDKMHIGSYVRRDLIVRPAWPHAGDGTVALDEGLVVYMPFVPSEPGAARKMYVEVGVASKNTRKKAKDNFRMVLFAAREGKLVASWDVAPGYDWLFPEKWLPTDVFVGKFHVELPKTMVAGRYDLGLVVFGADGHVIGATTGEGRSVGDEARVGGEEGTVAYFAPGEVQFPDALLVLGVAERDQASDADRAEAAKQATALDCAAAEESWWLARMHRPVDTEWRGEHEPGMRAALAECWAKSADGLQGAERTARLIRAREWDHWSAAYRERARVVADELYAEGMTARAAEDWEKAYRAFSDAVAVDRTRSWARRYAEEARAFRLGIDEASLAQRDREEAERKKAAEERSKALRDKVQSAVPGEAETEGEEQPGAPDDIPQGDPEGP
jgi:hypothetical protein